MDKDIAIKIENVSKTFKIPHEKVNSLRGAAVNIFKKKSYEEFKALDDVSFEVKKGEFFGIIGRNGSGKSTLLKILAGIYQVDSGKISISGLISPFLELGIGFNPELSGRDNIYLNATVLGLTKKQINEKFESIVKFSELERFIDQKLKNYSSGMQVRLAFSVAIHANRDILLMDEVLAVGDTNFQAKCLEEFHKYRAMGRTVLLVSHDIYTIQKYCDRALLLKNGKIKNIGKAAAITKEYLEDNILDEEVRMSSDKTNGNEEQKKQIQKAAKIVAVEFCDQNDSKKNVFNTGEILSIDVTYNMQESISEPVFGIIIRDGMKKNIYALNTEYKKINTGEFPAGKTVNVKFIINNFFATGSYFVSPAVATNTHRILDWVDDAFAFRVVNPDFNSNAIADFETKINIE